MDAYILCGGESKRMGADKGLVKFKNKPLVQYTIEVATPFFDNIFLLTSNPNYKQFGLELISDIYPKLGPLGGIFSALSHRKNQQIFILPCDVPLISKEFIAFFLEKSKQYKSAVVQHQEQLHPLIGKYDSALVPNIESDLKSQRLKMQQFVKENAITAIQCYPQFSVEMFSNFNTPEDLILHQKL